MYVYILSDYGEYGAENVTATLDRSKLMALIPENWPHDDKYFQAQYRDEWISAARLGLAKHLTNTDEELSAKQTGWECHSGWGGVQLHVVKLK